jgi:hypothetical protein
VKYPQILSRRRLCCPQVVSACLLLPFIVFCLADPALRDPGWVLLTGLPALGGIWLLVARWHSGRIIAVIITAVNQAAEAVLAGSEVERLLRDEAPLRGDGPVR